MGGTEQANMVRCYGWGGVGVLTPFLFFIACEAFSQVYRNEIFE